MYQERGSLVWVTTERRCEYQSHYWAVKVRLTSYLIFPRMPLHMLEALRGGLAKVPQCQVAYDKPETWRCRKAGASCSWPASKKYSDRVPAYTSQAINGISGYEIKGEWQGSAHTVIRTERKPRRSPFCRALGVAVPIHWGINQHPNSRSTELHRHNATTSSTSPSIAHNATRVCPAQSSEERLGPVQVADPSPVAEASFPITQIERDPPSYAFTGYKNAHTAKDNHQDR